MAQKCGAKKRERVPMFGNFQIKENCFTVLG